MTTDSSFREDSPAVYFHDEDQLYVLIVDDSPADLYLARDVILKRAGKVQHTEAQSFDAALKALHSQHFDVCLCDFRLDKGRTGLDLFLTARSHGYEMPFIAMTGAINELVAAETLITAGFDDVIDKSELLETNFDRYLRNACLRHNHTQHLIESANIDKLTGVLNHRGLVQALTFETKTAARTREPLAVAYFDINDFKKINDDYGHPVGDKYLKTFAKLLTESIGDLGFVGRIGSDKFVVGLAGTSADGAALVIKRLDRIMATPVQTGGATCDTPLTFCVGIAERTNSDPLDAPALIISAEHAMSAQKKHL